MKEEITFDQFAALDLRMATITKVEEIEKADKLYKVTLDAGELGERVVAMGVKAWYDPEELLDQQVVYLANLEPKELRGVKSQGMILAADDDQAVLLQPETPVSNGAVVR